MTQSDMSTSPSAPSTATAQPIAYLTGEYPRATDTFIQREVAALRALGVEVLTCSIRRTAAIHDVGEEQRSERARTFYILPAALRPWNLLTSHLNVLRRSPLRWLSALRLAWKTCPPGLKGGLWQLFYFAEAGVLTCHLLDRGVGHLHCHSADSSGTVTMLAGAMSNIPFSITLHGPGIFFEPMLWRIDEKIARARFIACISHFCRSQAMLFSDQTHWHKLRVVHCGVTPANYGSGLRDISGKHVLFVGRLDAVKGVPLLLMAFAEVRIRHPDARLTVVGDGPAKAALEAQAAALGVYDAITFTGFRAQAEVAAMMAKANILVLPSFAEGVPVVLMEAMASHVPVIASQVGGVPELVQDGVSGFVTPAGDLETLISRLDMLLTDPDLCRRMGAAGRKKVEAAYDVDREAAWLLSLLQGHGEGLRPDPESSVGSLPDPSRI